MIHTRGLVFLLFYAEHAHIYCDVCLCPRHEANKHAGPSLAAGLCGEHTVMFWGRVYMSEQNIKFCVKLKFYTVYIRLRAVRNVSVSVGSC